MASAGQAYPSSSSSCTVTDLLLVAGRARIESLAYPGSSWLFMRSSVLLNGVGDLEGGLEPSSACFKRPASSRRLSNRLDMTCSGSTSAA